VSAARAQVLLVMGALTWSGIEPHDSQIWLMETLPVMLFGGAMLVSWGRFPWTPLAAVLTTLFALILCLGGHYTYELVPLGDWMRDALDLQRNNYDRIGHFVQGVTPAILARELLVRCTALRPGKALFWIVSCVALAVSATYELIEWWSALLADPEAGMAFLGSQGDEWDAQWDMALALAGAICAQLVLGSLHDRQLATLRGSPGAPR
jgi:putative membrane protein